MPVTGEGSAPTLRSLPESFAAIRGASGQRRHDLLMQLFYGTSPIAAKYIVRMLSGDAQRRTPHQPRRNQRYQSDAST